MPTLKQEKALKAERDWQTLEDFGLIMYDSAWQTAMANDLGLKNPSHLRLWKRRGVPKKTWGKIKAVAEDKMVRLEQEVISKIEKQTRT